MDEPLVTVHAAQGEVEEQQVRSFLEAHGIATSVRGEALRKTHGLVLDGLGEVQILVAREQAGHARELLAAVARGELRLEADELPEGD
jgi:hypothetical protein